MKVIASTGLVPVRGLVRTNFRAGTVFGLAPAAAIKAVEAGEVALHPVPEGMETYEVAGPAERPQEAAAEAIPADVDIPEGWDDPVAEGGLHWMQRVKLAEKIIGTRLDVPAGMKPVEAADAVIRQELARREE